MINSALRPISAIFFLFAMVNSCSTKDELERFQLVTSVQPEEGGKVTPIEGNFSSGIDVKITATANAGYIFKTWSGASEDSSNSITVKMDSDKQITAIFEKLDIDDDGVFDDLDQCTGTPEGETVDQNGCSASQIDSDGDGIFDDLDQCTGTPEGETVDQNGCSASQVDNDGDGVVDDLDQCTGTPDGETVDENGCSASQVDSDGDGVVDGLDQCTGTPEGEAVDENGCSASQVDSDGDGVADDADQCSETPKGEIVNTNGCSQSQVDKTPPVVASITTTSITTTSFTVDWSLDEGSKGYIQFGTSPGVYIASTELENNFLNRHVQTVGGSNPFPLNSETTYYWQIFVEDQYGNSGFSDEQSTRTSEELTYIPDDVFEKNLVELGYDDALDNFVNTENINGVVSLSLTREFTYFIDDYTGLEAFKALEELIIGQPSVTLRIPEDINLKKLKIFCSDVDVLDLSNTISLEELRFYGDEPDTQCRTSINQVIGLENTINLKVLEFSMIGGDNLQEIINSATFIEQFIFHRILGRGSFVDNEGNYILDLSNNSNLKNVILNGGETSNLPDFVNIKNGANEKMESILITSWFGSTPVICIEADLPSTIQSTISAGPDDDISNVTVSTDCGY